MKDYIKGKEKDSKKALLFILILLATAIFILGLVSSFSLSENTKEVFLISIGIVYLIALITFVSPVKRKKESSSSSKDIFEEIENPEIKDMKNTVKEMKKLIPVIQNTKEKKINLEYSGSIKNKKYHLSTCGFAKRIKSKDLEKKEDREYFKSKKYKPCKVCKPNRK